MTLGAWTMLTVSCAFSTACNSTITGGPDDAGSVTSTDVATDSDITDSSSTASDSDTADDEAPSLAVLPSRLTGVNIAGGEFGKLPGKLFTDYVYPSSTEVDYFLGKGFNTIRIPFRWERVQPTAMAPVDMSELDTIIAYITSHEGYVLLDSHNYARYNGGVIGSADVAVDVFADFWGQLAQHYKDNAHVIFGLMNEPHGIEAELWLSDVNAAIAAIRATGATNLITVPGISWTGAHSWLAKNAEVMIAVEDPLDNFIYEMHQYFDSDSSGTHDTCVSETIGSQRLAQATQWLATNGFRALLGEFGTASNTTCMAALEDMVAYMTDHREQWIGWTYWAAGAWWGDYSYSVEPANGEDKPQMGPLATHAL